MNARGPAPPPDDEFEPYLLGEEAERDEELTADLPEEPEGGEHRQYTLSRNAKERLDKYLQNRLKATSRHQVQKLIALGGVTVNVICPSQGYRVCCRSVTTFPFTGIFAVPPA